MGESVSPCLTPLLMKNQSVYNLFTFKLLIVSEYIDLTDQYILPSIPFCKSASRSLKLKAFLKSINVVKVPDLLHAFVCRFEAREKTWSIQAQFLLNPFCSSTNKLLFSKYVITLLFRIDE